MQALLEILYTNNLSKSYKESVRYSSVALCAVGTSVTLHYLRPLRVSVCPLYKPFNLSSIFRKSLLLPCYHVFHYLVTMSLITLYHVFHYPVTMSYITLLPCLTLLCYHVFHYPVSIKECKTTKRVDKLIIPRSHTPQNN